MPVPQPLIPALDDAPLITGIGAVSPHGQDAGALFAALLDPAPRIDEPGWADLAGFPAPRHAILVRGFAAAPRVAPAAVRRLDSASKFAAVASAIALADAKLDPQSRAGTAVAAGTAALGTVPLASMLAAIYGAGPESCNPSDFPVTVANSAAGQIAILHGLKGPNLTLSQKENSGLAALCAGGFLLASGQAERVLVCASDDFSREQAAILNRLGALAREPFRDAGPFAKHRAGYLGGEGAYALLLETPAAAARRGARPLARLRGWGETHLGGVQHRWPENPRPLAELLGALGGAGRPEAVFAAANGSALDATEAAAFARAWGGNSPAITTAKWGLGETGAASLGGALLAVRAFSAGALPPIHHTRELDPELPRLDFVTGAPRALRGGPLAVCGISHGGAACAVLLEKTGPDAAGAPF